MWVVIFVASTAVLVGPLHRDVGSLTIQLSTLPEFLGEEGRGDGKGERERGEGGGVRGIGERGRSVNLLMQ